MKKGTRGLLTVCLFIFKLLSFLHDMLKLVEQDLGWAVVPKMLAEERVQLGTLKIFNAEFSHTEQTFLVDLLLAPMQSSGPVQAYLVEQLKSLSV